jgi:acyl carrier protein
LSRVAPDEVRAAILTVLSARLRERGLEPEDVPDSCDLLVEGLTDSFGLLELLQAIERRYQLTIDFGSLPVTELTVLGPLSRYIAQQINTANP